MEAYSIFPPTFNKEVAPKRTKKEANARIMSEKK